MYKSRQYNEVIDTYIINNYKTLHHNCYEYVVVMCKSQSFIVYN